MMQTIRLVLFILTIFLSGCVTYIDIFPRIQPLQEETIRGKGKEKILLIGLSGMIHEGKVGGFAPQPSMVSRIKEELNKAAKDDSIKGVVLRVNSPGGTVTASDIIYQELIKFKEETGKSIVTSIMGVGASGAYYIAMASDHVIAHPTAVTGSIGVIMMHITIHGLLEKFGVSSDAIKSGPHKDMGSPFKPLLPEDRALLQGVIDSMFEKFLETVQKGRPKLATEKVRELADGRIYTADQALAAGLIDEIGYLDQAIDRTMKMAGVVEAKVIIYKRPNEFKNTIYASGEPNNPRWSADPRSWLEFGTPKFLYLWMP